MGDMFRSEEMALCQLFIQPEAAYASVAELGESGCVQFRDLNADVSSFQRKYVNEVRRCDELQRKERYIENELRKDSIKLPVLDDDEEPSAPNPREIIDLEAQLESIDNELRELAGNEVNLKANFQNMTELLHVLENTEGFFSASEVMNLDSNRSADPNGDLGAQAQRGQLAFIAGVITLERFFAFERMLWRISHGNIFLRRSDISGLTEDSETGHKVLKTVFVAFFQGEQLKHRVKKVCTGFHASVYPCPSAHNERIEMIRDVRTRLEDLKIVLSQTDDHRNRVLLAASRNLPKWSIMVKKMKAIYHTLNCFNPDVSGKCLIAEGWVPKRDLEVVKNSLARASKSVESSIPSFLNVIGTDDLPPTYTRTNKFTNGFQNLVDAYGMATYREVNPALYTCITFPFLFAVMFGDMGHGVILLAFAMFLIIREKQLAKIKEEIFNIFFGGRYIIALMALFSIYTGFIYNDVFSKSMNIFGSGWNITYDDSMKDDSYVLFVPRLTFTSPYVVGMDPVWQLAENKIIFLNSFKMKMSIIFGVLHMVFGVCMSLINFAHFKKYSSIILEFVPQVLFLLVFFGYMVFMMFFKWVRYSDTASTPVALTPGCAPSILILFINMVLFGHTTPEKDCKEYLFEGQDTLQTIFLLVGVVCVPWMLLGKPIYKILTRPKIAPHANNVEDGNHQPAPAKTQTAAQAMGGHGGDDEPTGELFIQQAIHTIEYVLSTISHTASYLRLWALSLAHAQLSEVLWNMVLSKGFTLGATFSYGGAALIFLVFGAWSVLTVGILVLIEGLSAFLHTLRLHWVEFMSKFYEGIGYAFEPFSFKAILETSEED